MIPVNASGHVGDQTGGEDDSFVDHLGVQQRFEDASRTPGCLDDVDRLAVVGAAVGGITYVGHHGSRFDVLHQDGEVVDAIAGQVLVMLSGNIGAALLQMAVQGTVYTVVVFDVLICSRTDSIEQMSGQLGGGAGVVGVGVLLWRGVRCRR